jgi:hypothetical protein
MGLHWQTFLMLTVTCWLQKKNIVFLCFYLMSFVRRRLAEITRRLRADLHWRGLKRSVIEVMVDGEH